MGTVIMQNTVSVDGFIADAKDQVGPLFDWCVMVFGSGKRYFGSVDAQHLLEDPHTVIQGNRVRR
jgi:hypothetical protein